MDDRGRQSFPKHENFHRDIANDHNANRKRNLGNIPRSIRRKHKHIVVSRKRKKAGTHVLRELSAARSIIRVPRVGKTHTGPHTCRKKAPKLFTDGASSSDGYRVGLMLVSPKGKEYTYALRFEFKTTNMEAEYKALLVGLCISKEMKIQELAIFVDSQLVANQVKGLFEARQPTIKQYLEKTREILKNFSSYTMEHVRRDQNKKADALRKLALTTFSKLAKEVLVEVVYEKSIIQREVADIVKEEGDN
ncbi:reverse transcriptase domain-containing protein [Tanacetum coccineum]